MARSSARHGSGRGIPHLAQVHGLARAGTRLGSGGSTAWLGQQHGLAGSGRCTAWPGQVHGGDVSFDMKIHGTRPFSAGHRIGSAMPLQRGIGSKFGGATSAGHRNMVVVNESTLVWISGCDRRCHFSGSSDRTIGATSAGHRVVLSIRRQLTSPDIRKFSKYPHARGFEWWGGESHLGW